MKEKFKKIINKTNKFFLLLPISFLYFIGLGLSKLLYFIFYEKNVEEGWQIPKKIKKSTKFYEEMI